MGRKRSNLYDELRHSLCISTITTIFESASCAFELLDMPSNDEHIAIIGGGLCGIALAVALTHRSVPFRLYEARPSSTEIGAGINLNPAALRAFHFIDPELGEAVHRLCTKNPTPKEDVWMQFRYGRPTKVHKDYELLFELLAPPTGNMTAHRNELLRLIAQRCPEQNVSYNKKLVNLDQTEDGVILHFADGTTSIASIVIACDGIHSSVRTVLLQHVPEMTKPHFTNVVAYRGMLSNQQAIDVFGIDDAKIGQLSIGPDGYVVKYGVAGGQNVAVGLWTYDNWSSEEWVLQHRRPQMLRAFESFGPTIHRLMDAIPDPSCWATYAHTKQPEKPYIGRVCLIGDAAHSMPPHQGAGAGQAMEDACVLAEVLSRASTKLPSAQPTIECAFEAYHSVRTPHSQRVQEMGIDGMEFLAKAYKEDMDAADIERFQRMAHERWNFVWAYDVAVESHRARQIMLSSA